MDCYALTANVEQMLFWYKKMQEQNIAPDVAAFNCLITGFGRIGNIEEMVRCTETMTTLGLHPDRHTFNRIITTFAKQPQPQGHYYYYFSLTGKLMFSKKSSIGWRRWMNRDFDLVTVSCGKWRRNLIWLDTEMQQILSNDSIILHKLHKLTQ